MTDLRKALTQTEQEPVAMINVQEQKLEWARATYWRTPTVVNMDKIPLYTAPPKREWVGLTDEELPEGATYEFDRGVRWAEAKLKEKNT